MFPDITPTADRVLPSGALNWQARRGYANARRLEQDVSKLAVANGATCLGRDDDAGALFDRVGIGADAIAVVRFRTSGAISTVAVPTFRTWNQSSRRRATAGVAEAAFGIGRIIIIASPLDVMLQPRLENAGRICRSMLPPAAGDADVVRSRIRSGGDEASLQACAAALGPPSAVGRVFGLMVGGCLAIDLATTLGADSAVRLRPDGWVFDWDMFGWQAVRCR